MSFSHPFAPRALFCYNIPMRHRQTKVLLAMAWHETGHLLGISRHACEKNWLIDHYQVTTDDKYPLFAQQMRDFQPRGIISQLPITRPGIVGIVKAARVPVVELCWGSHMEVPCVLPDEEGEGAIAATHLRERGFTQFVFVGNSSRPGNREGFTRAVRAAGHEAHMVITDAPEMEAETGNDGSFPGMLHDLRSSLRRAWARRFFSRCDKPVGVYTLSTAWASDIIEGCRAAHVRVPEQVAVIGLADMLDEGKAWPVPLTVIVPDFEQQGYQAAALLERMMHGEHVSPDTVVKIPPLALVPRMSTMCHATANLPIARAAAFIMRNLHDPGLCVKQIHHAAKTSYNTFYRDFSRQFNMPVAWYIEHLRVEEAARLLVTTDTGITALAVQCGFGDVLRFRRAFGRVKGVAPSVYRKQHGEGSGVNSRGLAPGPVPASRRDNSIRPPLVVAQAAASGQQEAQVEAQVELAKWLKAVLTACSSGERTGRELLHAAGYRNRTGNFKKGIRRLVNCRLIELTIPDKPNSRLQKYRLTDKGRLWLQETKP